MAQKANSLSHTKWLCKYHIVFTPKYRRKVIYNQYRKDLGERADYGAGELMERRPGFKRWMYLGLFVLILAVIVTRTGLWPWALVIVGIAVAHIQVPVTREHESQEHVGTDIRHDSGA